MESRVSGTERKEAVCADAMDVDGSRRRAKSKQGLKRREGSRSVQTAWPVSWDGLRRARRPLLSSLHTYNLFPLVRFTLRSSVPTSTPHYAISTGCQRGNRALHDVADGMWRCVTGAFPQSDDTAMSLLSFSGSSTR